MSSQARQPDEVFCWNCGTAIDGALEDCPSCSAPMQTTLIRDGLEREDRYKARTEAAESLLRKAARVVEAVNTSEIWAALLALTPEDREALKQAALEELIAE